MRTLVTVLWVVFLVTFVLLLCLPTGNAPPPRVRYVIIRDLSPPPPADHDSANFSDKDDVR